MGGCRCSYRNCKVRSDGQTHMFHFPVFDKMRCHQWITNSLKPNFLNLKLSQLRNRVVCQHHFRDDNFMNFLLDKLKSDAVPTEDGPFCVSDLTHTLVFEEDDKPAIPINADDIENEKLNSVEKKAHSSVKYGDFLISDVTELFNSSHNSIDNLVSQKVSSKKLVKNKTKALAGKALDSKFKSQNHEEIHNYTINYSNDEQMKAIDTLSSFNATPNPAIVAVEYEEPTNPSELVKTTGQVKKSVEPMNPDKVVKIISEKTISEPLVVGGKLQPMSPSMIIRRPVRKLKTDQVNKQNDWETKPDIKTEESTMNINLQTCNNNTIPLEQTIILETIPIEYAPKDLQTNNENNQNAEKQSEVININNIEYQNNVDGDQKQIEIPLEQAFLNCMLESAQKLKPKTKYVTRSKTKQPTPISSTAYKSLLKSKIPPAKLAAIEEKRKFNLKLRDVITSCLDNLDEQNDNIDIKMSPESKQTGKNKFFSKAPSPVTSQATMIAYLEARLQKMEDTLLNKIDLNTNRINDLKRSMKPSMKPKHANTQTYINHMSDESQKQYLYKEISKFLSPNANIKIYEELFLGKTSHDELETSTPRKLRKRR